MNIEQVPTVTDHKRGCGWRKEGGLYLRLDGAWTSCGKLPLALEVCPCCGTGIKPARSWTWFNPAPFLDKAECGAQKAFEAGALNVNTCETCPMMHPPEKAGLLWIGEKFYPRPYDWMEEAKRLGVSRRIKSVPHGFKIGDRVYLAHLKALSTACACGGKIGKDCATCEGEGTLYRPGIFTTFVPDRIEYVCKGTESEEELDKLVERGISPVKVQRAAGEEGGAK